MVKISAPVGDGKKATNDQKDVKIVQILLNKHASACGYKPVSKSGTVDKALILAIRAFQKEAVGIKPDGLVEPGKKTMKHLTMDPKKVAAMCGGAEELPKGKVFVVSWRGEKIAFTEKDMAHALSAISKRLSVEVTRFEGTLDAYADEVDDLTSGAISFMVQLLMPDNWEVKEARKDIDAARKMVAKMKGLASKKDQKSLLAAFKMIEPCAGAVKTAYASLMNLARAMGESAGFAKDIATDVRDGSADAAQIILMANGVDPATAGAVVGGTTAAVQELANSVITSGQWVKEGGVAGSFKRVGFGVFKGGFLGWIGGAVGKFIMGKVGTKLAMKWAQSAVIERVVRSGGNVWVNKLLLAEATTVFGKKLAAKMVMEETIKVIVRRFNKYVTAKAIVAALTAAWKQLEPIFEKASKQASNEAGMIDSVTKQLDGSKLGDQVLSDLLMKHKKSIQDEVMKELKSAKAA